MGLLTTTVARIAFALPFGVFGAMHFMMGPKMTGAVPAWLPGSLFWVYFTGAALLAACAGLISKKYGAWAALGLAALLLTFILTIHVPSLLGGDQMAMTGLMKDLALLGGALTYAGILKSQQ